MACMCTATLAAQPMNNIAVWGDGGYATWLTSGNDVRSSAGWGAALGVGYELHYKKFMMQVGAEFSYQTPALFMTSLEHIQALTDTEGEAYTGCFEFTDNRDRYRAGYVNVPLLFGFTAGRFYLLAGAKLGLNVMAGSQVSSTVKSTGIYDRFIDPFEDMPNHYFQTSTVSHDFPVTLGLNCAASAEIGFYIGNKQAEKQSSSRWRLDAFCDYGLLNANSNSPGEQVLHDASSPTYQPYLNNFMRATGVKANPLCAGFKLTVVFGIQDRYDCRCAGYDQPKHKRLRGIQ